MAAGQENADAFTALWIGPATFGENRSAEQNVIERKLIVVERENDQLGARSDAKPLLGRLDVLMNRLAANSQKLACIGVRFSPRC